MRTEQGKKVLPDGLNFLSYLALKVIAELQSPASLTFLQHYMKPQWIEYTVRSNGQEMRLMNKFQSGLLIIAHTTSPFFRMTQQTFYQIYYLILGEFLNNINVLCVLDSKLIYLGMSNRTLEKQYNSKILSSHCVT